MDGYPPPPCTIAPGYAISPYLTCMEPPRTHTGVGLSYSEHAADYVVDDGRTAQDADAFLRGWFARYPQYQANDFYVRCGEGVGAVCVRGFRPCTPDL